MNNSEWLAWWLKQAPTYFTDMIFQFSRPDLIKRLNIERSTTVLEIGHGYGRELSQFCKLSDDVYGVDLTEHVRQLCLQKVAEQGVQKPPSLLVYNGVDLPFGDSIFDVIYSCFVVQHISRVNAVRLLREALRVLKPGGRVLFEFFGDPAYHHPTEDRYSGNPDDGTGMFNNAYQPDDIERLARAAGATIEWQADWPITKEWGNHWVCFQRRAAT